MSSGFDGFFSLLYINTAMSDVNTRKSCISPIIERELVIALSEYNSAYILVPNLDIRISDMLNGRITFAINNIQAMTVSVLLLIFIKFAYLIAYSTTHIMLEECMVDANKQNTKKRYFFHEFSKRYVHAYSVMEHAHICLEMFRLLKKNSIRKVSTPTL